MLIKKNHYTGFIFSLCFLICLGVTIRNGVATYAYPSKVNIVLLVLTITLTMLFGAILHQGLDFKYEWPIFKYLNPVIKLTEKMPLENYYWIVAFVGMVFMGILGNLTGVFIILAFTTLLLDPEPEEPLEIDLGSKEKNINLDDSKENK